MIINSILDLQQSLLQEILHKILHLKRKSFCTRVIFFTVICLTLILTIEAKINFENLRRFFQLTYDQNDDKQVTWTEFCNYFKLIEPDHYFAFNILNSAFNAFDLNKDNKIRLEELIDFSQMEFSVKTGHKQIHLGFTENQNQMQVMWVSNPEEYLQPAVFFGQYPTKLDQIQKATISKYHIDKVGFHGINYRAVMKNLKPRTQYFYKVGDIKTQTFSEIKHFKSPPNKNATLQQIHFAVFGDMGTYIPFGHLVSKMIQTSHMAHPYDFIFLTGDVAYAGLGHKETVQLEPIWDLFGEQIEGISSTTAFMPGVGNHEAPNEFSSYLNRYRLPRKKQNQTNLWFSFDYGQVHVVYISSEHEFGLGSEQYDFLQQDLRDARSNPNIKWIILGAHKAFYYSDKKQFVPISPLAAKLQDLINKYKVDLVQTAHLHSYQRTWPVYKGKTLKGNHTSQYYINPQTPIYVVQGTGGAMINEKWLDPSPQWSLKRSLKYGYGRITIKANYLKYQFVTLPVGKVIDTWYIIKDQNAANTIIQNVQ